MQSQLFLRGYAREGGTPSLATHPQEQPQHQDQNQEQQQNQGRLHRELDRSHAAPFFCRFSPLRRKVMNSLDRFPHLTLLNHYL